jgi:hypothetical protein
VVELEGKASACSPASHLGSAAATGDGAWSGLMVATGAAWSCCLATGGGYVLGKFVGAAADVRVVAAAAFRHPAAGLPCSAPALEDCAGRGRGVDVAYDSAVPARARGSV